tara:strand:+ start:12376 stop:14094 length:1719 start_codon:yes stop_codon:yes gene_type:complete
MIVFNELRYKNILSTGNDFTIIDFTRNPSTLVVGINGSGKSTILDALCFVLFGKPFRRINKPKLVNSINKKGLLVEVDFSIGPKQYKIIRGIKPNIFEIYINDLLINQEATIKDYQSYLEKSILKLNYKSFTQIVVLGSSSFIPFMQLTAANRRDVIEDLLDIQIFSLMNVLLKSKIVENKEILSDLIRDIELVEEKIRLQSNYIKTIQKDNERKVETIQDEIDKLNLQNETHSDLVRELGEKIRELQALTIDEPNFTQRKTEIGQIKSKLQQRESRVSKRIKFFEDNEICPTCTQDIDGEFRQQILEENKTSSQEITTALDNLHEKFNLAGKRLKEIATIQEKIKGHLDESVSLNNMITLNSQLIDRMKDEISAHSDLNLQAEHDKLDTLGGERSGVKGRHTTLKTRQVLFSFAAGLLKDSGIKTRIIRQYIPIINKLVNKFLASMDFYVQFELDENFQEHIRSRHRDDFSYMNFSEGEKQKIDLALLFTWRAIARLRNSVATNLLIMDEVFDSSLDQNGTEELMKIIEGMETSGKTNVFVISHKTDVLTDKFRNIIVFEKKNNFSRIVGD